MMTWLAKYLPQTHKVWLWKPGYSVGNYKGNGREFLAGLVVGTHASMQGCMGSILGWGNWDSVCSLMLPSKYINKIGKFLKKKLNNNNKKEWRKLQLPPTPPTGAHACTHTMTFYHCGLHRTNTTLLSINFSASTPSIFVAGNSFCCGRRLFAFIRYLAGSLASTTRYQ